ncbi:MAG: alpha/beta hydrolase [Hyphomicrobiales bacterium]|nr:MAG: alpha/beta hydrolase [Hyphomicrobiales bacterium]
MTEFSWSDGANGFLQIGSSSLEYACYGAHPNEATTIVMLHEGLGCVALWRDFPKLLAKATGHGVFVYSRAAYGKSDACDLPRPLDYMTGEAMDVLPVVLNEIGLQKIILLGHSDGATIAAIYAGMGGDMRVRGVILMAPHFFTEELGLKSIAEAKVSYETGDLREKLTKYHGDVDCAFKGWNDVWLDPKFKSWDVTDVIDYLRIPVLAIQGRDDEYGTLAQIEEIENRIYSPVDVEIFDDCGHGPHLDQIEKTLATIEDFTSRLDHIEKVVVRAA